MRSEIEICLRHQGLVFFDLPLSIRLLLVTDGTVTELLEAMLSEPVILGYQMQELTRFEQVDMDLPGDLSAQTPCLWRCVTLLGEYTRTHWVYAESVILHEDCSDTVRDLFLNSKQPIGSVLQDQGMDNRRQFMNCGMQAHPPAARQMGLADNDEFLYRFYCIFVGQQVLLGIREWFPLVRLEQRLKVLYQPHCTVDRHEN